MAVTTPEYLRELATFIAGTTIERLPENVRARGRMILADTIPVIGAGMRESAMRAFTERVLAGGAGRAWVIGAGRRASARAKYEDLSRAYAVHSAFDWFAGKEEWPCHALRTADSQRI